MISATTTGTAMPAVPFNMSVHASHPTRNSSQLCLQIQGEKLILKANGANGTLATCALRPSGLFGKGDTTFWPTVVAKANQGKMKYIIGNGQNLVEFTYVGNVAQAHLQVKLGLLFLVQEVSCEFVGSPPVHMQPKF